MEFFLLQAAKGGAFSPAPGQTVEFKADSASCGPLQIKALRKDWWQCASPSPAATTEGESLRIFQCDPGESPGEFVARVMAVFGQSWAPPDGSDAPLDPQPLKSSWPEGGVCMAPPGCDASDLSNAIVSILRETDVDFRGLSPGLQKGAGPGEWRFRFHCRKESNSDPNHVTDLVGGWRMAPHPRGIPGHWISQTGQILNAKALDSLLGKFIDSDARSIEGAGMKFPRLPMTVRFGKGGTPFFAETIALHCRYSPAQNKTPWALHVWIKLEEDSRGAGFVYRDARMLLAECVEGPPGEGEKLYRLRPPSKPPGEPSLQAACRWTLVSDKTDMIAARVVPGFVRPDQAAFYSKLEAGDLVWIRVSFGELPLIMGSLHQRFGQWEEGEGAADVAIGSRRIEIRAAKGSTVRVEDKNITLAASDEVAMRTKSVSASENLEVSGLAVFKGDVKLG